MTVKEKNSELIILNCADRIESYHLMYDKANYKSTAFSNGCKKRYYISKSISVLSKDDLKLLYSLLSPYGKLVYLKYFKK